jgi:anti-sigma regulatory factor (Ser/Thr protein kinase)/anti-anti-sigma regulatory factor
MAGNALQCEVEHDADVVTVRVHGPLRVETVPVLHSTVLKSLTNEPVAVVLDVADVDEVDDLALMIFPTLARAAAAWPGAKLILMHAPTRLVARLRATSFGTLVTIANSDAAVRAAASEDSSPPMLREHLPSGPGAVTQARAMVRRVCATSLHTSLADDAELVVSELVTNATLHGLPPLSLTVTRRPKYLHVAVRDSNPQVPRLGGRETEEIDGRNGGRGLLVIEALCVAWGCTPTADGKVVWATLRSRRPAD